jgi:hypothetical protein
MARRYATSCGAREFFSTLLGLVHDILGERVTRLLKDQQTVPVDEAYRVLSCAALEGTQFTADAVARAISWDRDQLIDFLDDRFVADEGRPEGLIQEVGASTVNDPRSGRRDLWRYAFRSDLHWLTLRVPNRTGSRSGTTSVWQNGY